MSPSKYPCTQLSLAVGYTQAYPRLVPKAPQVSLLAPLPILSIALQMCVVLPVQLLVWLFTTRQPWFEPLVPNEDEDYTCHEVTVVFLVSSFQYVTTAVVFSKGAPYRKTVFSNCALWFLFHGDLDLINPYLQMPFSSTSS